jgi:hypothetical protein
MEDDPLSAVCDFLFNIRGYIQKFPDCHNDRNNNNDDDEINNNNNNNNNTLRSNTKGYGGKTH